MKIPLFRACPRAGLEKTEYPVAGIAAVIAMLCLVPFTTGYLAYLAFILCVFRMFLYNSKVFATDLALLSSFSLLFNAPGGDSLLTYLVILGAVWYFFLQRIRLDASLFLFAALFCFLITRMGGQYTTLLIVVGSLLIVRCVVAQQDERSSVYVCRAFCIGIILSSVYAFIFRNSSRLEAVKGSEVAAYYGSSSMRFQGLFEDPNYFAVFLILAIVLIIRLWLLGHSRTWPSLAAGVLLMSFGMLTYSKSFLIAAVMVALSFLIILLTSKRITTALFIILLCLLAAFSSAFSIISYRLQSFTTFDQLTTGRLELFTMYLELITGSPLTLFFGHGLGARLLYRGTHNIYLETLYYIGVTGLLLYFAYFISLAWKPLRQNKEGFIQKYFGIAVFLVLYFALHGITASNFYIQTAVLIISMMMTKKEPESPAQ